MRRRRPFSFSGGSPRPRPASWRRGEAQASAGTPPPPLGLRTGGQGGSGWAVPPFRCQGWAGVHSQWGRLPASVPSAVSLQPLCCQAPCGGQRGQVPTQVSAAPGPGDRLPGRAGGRGGQSPGLALTLPSLPNTAPQGPQGREPCHHPPGVPVSPGSLTVGVSESRSFCCSRLSSMAGPPGKESCACWSCPPARMRPRHLHLLTLSQSCALCQVHAWTPIAQTRGLGLGDLTAPPRFQEQIPALPSRLSQTCQRPDGPRAQDSWKRCSDGLTP